MQLVQRHPVAGQNQRPGGYSLSIIVPVFNEADMLETFHHTLCKVLAGMPDEHCQVIYVNDGSTDDSWQILTALHSPFADVQRINLSRNFGKEAAMTAGLDHARGEAVTLLDADLQDPPDLLPDMLATLRQGFDVVNMQRRTRLGESRFKLACARHYYRLLKWMSDTPVESEVGDFRMLTRRVVEDIQRLPERNRYMKGLMSWPGYRKTTLLFDRPQRQAGQTKWSFLQLCGLALSGITAFSVKPLRMATFVGALVSTSAFLYGCWVLMKTVLFGESVAGYPSLMLIMLFLGGVQLLGLGIVGEYVGRIFIESKSRPIYLVSDEDIAFASAVRDIKHYG